MKKGLFYILIFVFLATIGNTINFGVKWKVAPVVQSSVNGFVTCGSLNVRKAPWQNILGTIHRGDCVKIVGQDLKREWYKIKYNGRIAYVYKRYINSSVVSVSQPSSPPSAGTTTSTTVSGFPFDGHTTVSSLNVRKSAWGTIVDRFTRNTKVTVVDKQGNWYRIKYRSGYAWVHSKYVTKGGSTSVNNPPSSNPGTNQPTTPPVTSGNYTPNNAIGKAGDSRGVKQDMNGRTYDPNKTPDVERWRSLVEKYFKPNRVDLALSVIYRESRGQIDAVNSSSGCTGLFQQHPKYWAARATGVGCAGASMTDAEVNIAASAALSNQGENWSHWGL
ncbi:SH3 domain-containing protein [bacterium]|nr:SH3 domain-containing protein [bacterium]